MVDNQLSQGMTAKAGHNKNSESARSMNEIGQENVELAGQGQ
jgi:hypothetical protein